MTSGALFPSNAVEALHAELRKVLPGMFGKPPPTKGSKLFPTIGDQVLHDAGAIALKRALHTAEKPWFRHLVAAAIVVDSILIGLELDLVDIGVPAVFHLCNAIDFLCLLLFLAEMLLRQDQMGWDCFSSYWVMFDYFLLALHCNDWFRSVSTQGGVRLAATIRMLRPIRAASTLERLRSFEALWLVATSLIASIRTLVWVAVFLLISIYILAVALTMVLGPVEEMERWSRYDVYTGGVANNFLTLLQVFTFDAWFSDIVRPLLSLGRVDMAMIFFASILVGNFGIANVALGIMVERLQIIKREKAARQGQVLNDIEARLFAELWSEMQKADLDNSDSLSLDEMEALLKEGFVLETLHLLEIRSAEAEEFFQLMAGEAGDVKLSEFIRQLRCFRGSARSTDMAKLLGLVSMQNGRAIAHVARMRELGDRADEMRERLHHYVETLDAELVERRDRSKRTQMQKSRARSRQRTILASEAQRVSFPQCASLVEPEASVELT